jgi:hypothetical protein
VDVWYAAGLAQDESPPTLPSSYKKKKVKIFTLINNLYQYVLKTAVFSNPLSFLFNKTLTFIRFTKPNPPVS